ncbi:MAG: hypothetical protein O2971_06430 [Proteobacteria bacterium]|nr:hypothetical protein [Pseudomonadota bacterium]
MGSLLEELRRRKVFRTAAVYTVGAWVLVQVADILLPTFNAPLWINQAIIIVLLLGFPVALALAWAVDLTPEGIIRTSESSDYLAKNSSSNRFSAIALGLVTFAVAFLFVDRYFLVNQLDGTGSNGEPIAAVASNLSKTFINLEKLQKRSEGGYASFDFTPDSRAIVYTSFNEGIYKLHTRELTELGSETILENDDGIFLPKISPDGQRILYWSESELRVMPVQGGASQTITAAVVPNSHAWLTQNTVVYTRNPDFSIHVVDINGEELQSFGSSLNRNGIYIDPEPLPGTSSILYSVGANNEYWEMHLVDQETGASTPLIRDAFESQYMNSGHIIFVRAGFLWAAPFDIDSLQITGSAFPIVDGVQNVYNYAAAAYAVSSQGELIYLGGPSEYIDVYSLVMVDSNGAEESLKLEPGNYREPTISPSGSHLALSVIQPGGVSDIWVYDFSLGVLNRITTTGGAMNPVWFPNGEQIAFNDIQSDLGLWVANSDGTGQPQRLFGEDILSGPSAFSPDGNYLVYIQGSHPAWDIKVLDMTGNTLVGQDLISTQFEERQASISPDGRWIAYVSHETDHSEIYVRPFPNVDDNKWRVTSTGGEEPQWSAEDGTLYLYYISLYESFQTLVRVPVSANPNFSFGKIETVTEIDRLEANEPSYAISPIDHRVLLIRELEVEEEGTDHPSQAIFVDNWSEEINRLAPSTVLASPQPLD